MMSTLNIISNVAYYLELRNAISVYCIDLIFLATKVKFVV